MDNTCFVIMPFGGAFDEYYDKILAPAVEKARLKPVRADHVYGTQAIIDDVFEQIVRAELVLCDATGRNPNVNYELGVSHALRKPGIIITQDIDDVPFDYRHLRVIRYDTKRVSWATDLESAITKTILSVLANPDRALAWKGDFEEAREGRLDVASITISYSLDPSQAVLRYRDQLVHLSTRAGDVHDGFKQFFAEIYEDVKILKQLISEEEFLQLRRIYHDDKRGGIEISVDLIHNEKNPPSLTMEQLTEGLHDGMGWYSGQIVSVDARIVAARTWSDSFFPNAPEYYGRDREGRV